jgi:hypothetical protein
MATEFSITVDTAAASAMLASWTGEEYEKRATGAMNESLAFLQAEVQKRTPHGVTGVLRGSIFTELRGTPLDQFQGIVAPGAEATYAYWVEEGRGPGTPPPFQAIKRWVIAKGLGGSEKEINQITGAIRWWIHAFGTKGQHMFRDTYEACKDRIPGIWQRWFSA